MKQEHKLVAELYRYLAPFINVERDIYISLDGQAAMNGVNKGTFVDGTIPDLWFTLLGASMPTLVEAKTIDTNGRLLLMQSQLKAWRSDGIGAHKPDFWVATNRAFDTFFFWSHAEFLPVLARTAASTNTLTLLPPARRLKFPCAATLALHILRESQLSCGEVI